MCFKTMANLGPGDVTRWIQSDLDTWEVEARSTRNNAVLKEVEQIRSSMPHASGYDQALEDWHRDHTD